MNSFFKHLISPCLLLISPFLLISSTLSLATTVEPVPNVLVTIKPVHSLVAGVMKGVAKPALLMKSNQSLHHYSLRPSERRLISQASLIFWVGPELEVFLPRLLSNNTVTTKNVSLIESKNLLKLKVQSKNQHDEHHPHQTDPHIWLSTQNAMALVDEITLQLVGIDPRHKKQYEKNQAEIKNKIVNLSARLQNQMTDTKQPYITFHNSIGYFEDEFSLRNIASIQANPETQPSAQHIRNIVQMIKRENISCLFYNQPEKPRLITSLQNQTQASSYALDPVGMNIQAGENAWFEIMENITSNLNSCLNK